MKIVTGMIALLGILTLGYFIHIWRQLPTVGPNVATLVPQDESVQMRMSGAETPRPTFTPAFTPTITPTATPQP